MNIDTELVKKLRNEKKPSTKKELEEQIDQLQSYCMNLSAQVNRLSKELEEKDKFVPTHYVNNPLGGKNMYQLISSFVMREFYGCFNDSCGSFRLWKIESGDLVLSSIDVDHKFIPLTDDDKVWN